VRQKPLSPSMRTHPRDDDDVDRSEAAAREVVGSSGPQSVKPPLVDPPTVVAAPPLAPGGVVVALQKGDPTGDSARPYEKLT